MSIGLTMTDIAGFGSIQDAWVVLRPPRQSFTCKERRAGLTVDNDQATDIAFVRLDGGFYPEGNACDFSVSSQGANPVGFLLELKGRNMEHGIGQLAKTLERLKGDAVSITYRQAVVVSSGAQKIPSGTWQKRQKTFLSDTHIHLGRKSNHAKVKFGEMLPY